MAKKLSPENIYELARNSAELKAAGAEYSALREQLVRKFNYGRSPQPDDFRKALSAAKHALYSQIEALCALGAKKDKFALQANVQSIAGLGW